MGFDNKRMVLDGHDCFKYGHVIGRYICASYVIYYYRYIYMCFSLYLCASNADIIILPVRHVSYFITQLTVGSQCLLIMAMLCSTQQHLVQ